MCIKLVPFPFVFMSYGFMKEVPWKKNMRVCEKPHCPSPILCHSKHTSPRMQKMLSVFHCSDSQKHESVSPLVIFTKETENLRSVFMGCSYHAIATIHFLRIAFWFSFLIKKCILQVTA